MPVKLKSLDAGSGVLFIGEGLVSGDDLIRCNHKILASPEKTGACRYCIIDYSTVTKFAVSTDEIETIASQDLEIAKYIPYYLVAIAAHKDLEFGVSRMWETIIKTNDLLWETMVFRNRDDAEKWIQRKMRERYAVDVTAA